jgi:hypothetical protein
MPLIFIWNYYLGQPKYSNMTALRPLREGQRSRSPPPAKEATPRPPDDGVHSRSRRHRQATRPPPRVPCVSAAAAAGIRLGCAPNASTAPLRSLLARKPARAFSF